jgi:FkbM family methyltransferase
MDAFMDRLLAVVMEHLHPVEGNNVDYLRFPKRATARARLRDSVAVKIAKVARALGFCYLRGLAPGILGERLSGITARETEYEHLWRSLADDESRELMVLLLAYRVLGPSRVRLPLADRYERDSRRTEALVRTPRTQRDDLLGFLDEFDLTPLGAPITLEAHKLSILNTFILRQCEFRRGETSITASKGDVVVDAGACWGDTTLYFAERVGDHGLVIAYEFEPGNLAIFQRNLARNEQLAGRIRLVERAVWSEGALTLPYASNSAGTHVSTDQELSRSVLSDTIDDLVKRERLSRVDFIKMDIEGAELEALKGARETILMHQPKLAISAYHHPDHIWQISKFLEDLGAPYRFFLDHFTMHAEETVLFCLPRTENP